MSKDTTPRVEINLDKIRHNATTLKNMYGKKGIQITGVVKGVGANLEVVKAFLASGISSLADTKVSNLEKLRQANIKATFIYLRPPAPSEVKQVVKWADISMNTELDVIQALSAEAAKHNKVHQIILMIEMGDLREGILLRDVPLFIEEVLKLPGVQIVGLGTNFACYGGVIPTERKMRKFSDFVKEMQQRYSLFLSYISGGNSANYQWFKNTKDVGAVNHIRLGESILLGRETVHGNVIPGLYTDAFCLIAEVIESKWKPSVPFGERGRNAFGQMLTFRDRGIVRRAIVGIGRQDVLVTGLTPLQPVEILGSSSDHIILDSNNYDLKPGDTISFSLNYGALLSVMTSPYVHKKYVNSVTDKLGSSKTPA